MEYSVIVLAAGKSTRLGFPKQLLCFENKTLISRLVEECLGVPNTHVYVVKGPITDLGLKPHPRVTEIQNAEFQRGIGRSIKVSLKFLLENRHNLDQCHNGLSIKSRYQAYMIVAVDQIYVDRYMIESLFTAHFQVRDQIDFTVSDYGEDSGLPIVFGNQVLPFLLDLEDQKGAKSIWSAPGTRLQKVFHPRASIDLDTPEDCLMMGIDIPK